QIRLAIRRTRRRRREIRRAVGVARQAGRRLFQPLRLSIDADEEHDDRDHRASHSRPLHIPARPDVVLGDSGSIHSSAAVVRHRLIRNGALCEKILLSPTGPPATGDVFMTQPDDRQAYALHTRLEAWVSRSTPLLIAVIVLITGFGTFGAVREWFPRPGMPATTSPGLANDATNGALARPQPTAASAHPSRESALAPNVTAPTAAGRLSIVTDPAGARVDVD